MIKRGVSLGLMFFFILVGLSWAMKWDFHGSLINSVWTTDNSEAMSNAADSRKVDWFVANVSNQRYYGRKKGDALANLSDLEKFDGDNSAFVGYTKGRFRIEGTTDDGMAKFVYGLEVGGYIWGEGKYRNFGYSGDGINTETRFLYGQIRFFGGILRAGLQPTGINHWVWTETAAGLTYHYKADLYNLMLGWYRMDAGENKFDMDSNDEALVAKVDYKLNQDVNLGFFAIYHDQGKESANGTSTSFTYNNHSYYLGFTGKAKFAPFYFAWDVIYQGGELDFENNAADDMDRSAWLVHLKAGYEVSDNFRVWARFLYVSGDDDADETNRPAAIDNDINNFESIDVDVKVGMILFKEESLRGGDKNYLDAPYIGPYGLINYALYGEYQIDPRQKVKMAVMYHQTDVDLIDGDGSKDNDLGWEFDLWYDYKYSKNVTFKVEAAYFVAGDALDALARDDDADDMYFLGGGVVFKF